MGPEEETVEEAGIEYIKAVQKREEEAEKARKAAWFRWDLNVIEAKRKLDNARAREDREKMMRQAYELLHSKTSQEWVNGL